MVGCSKCSRFLDGIQYCKPYWATILNPKLPLCKLCWEKANRRLGSKTEKVMNDGR